MTNAQAATLLTAMLEICQVRITDLEKYRTLLTESERQEHVRKLRLDTVALTIAINLLTNGSTDVHG